MKTTSCDASLKATSVAELAPNVSAALDLEKWTEIVRPLLARFHLQLDEVEDSQPESAPTFVGGSFEGQFLAAAAISALGTWLHGGRGAGRGAAKNELANHKRRADAVSAYILSEALSVCSRGLADNHALVVVLGEGRMLKSGESLEGGNNPRIAFGHVFARPEATRNFYDSFRLLEQGKPVGEFLRDSLDKGLVVWGTAIDNLENTSRFALGCATGPAVVFHVFDRPLTLAKPYECYMGLLTLPEEVIRVAERRFSLNYLTPRREILHYVREAFPHVPAGNVHVWTLTGRSRSSRLSGLWQEWEDLGVHLVQPGWIYPPTGRPVFTDSGTYMPTYCVGEFDVDGQSHLFLVDGYAASTEAIQAASLNRALRQRTFLYSLTETFQHPLLRECQIMRISLDGGIASVQQQLDGILGRKASESEARAYSDALAEADRANMPRGGAEQSLEHFFLSTHPESLAISAMIMDDPYSGIDGIRRVGDSAYSVCARAVGVGVNRVVRFTFKIAASPAESNKAFLPLLDFSSRRDRTEAPILDASEVESFLNELRVLYPDYIRVGEDGMLNLHVGQTNNTGDGPDGDDPIADEIRRILNANSGLNRRLRLDELELGDRA